MAEKYEIIRLPVTEEFLRVKRVVTPQGESAYLEDGARISHLAWFTLKSGPGNARGGHYHLKRTETFYIASGRARVRFKDLDTGETGELLVEAGEKIIIRPGLAHLFEAISDLSMIEYYDVAYDPEDVYVFEVLAAPDRGQGD